MGGVGPFPGRIRLEGKRKDSQGRGSGQGIPLFIQFTEHKNTAFLKNTFKDIYNLTGQRDPDHTDTNPAGSPDNARKGCNVFKEPVQYGSQI